MNTFQRYTSRYISILFNTEKQYCSFVDVFNYKASHLLLKTLLFSLHKQARQHQLTLHSIMKALHLKREDISSDGIRGIFKEAFYMIEDVRDNESVDDIMIFSLIQAAYYKLGLYHHIQALLHPKDLKEFSEKIERMIQSEEQAILELQEIQSAIHLDKFGKDTENLLFV